MESYQITLNSRTASLQDNQKRSVMNIQLGRDAVPIPKFMQCSVSVISAEILNNIYSIDAYTFKSVYMTNPLYSVTATTTTGRLTFSPTEYASFASFPLNTGVIFTGANVLSVTNNQLQTSFQCYIKTFFPTTYQILVSYTSGGATITGFTANSAVTSFFMNIGTPILPVQYLTNLIIPAGNYTPATLATALTSNLKTIDATLYGSSGTGKIVCAVNANNILTFTGSNVSLYFNKQVPCVGFYNTSTIPTTNIITTCSSPPFLQQKYLQIGSSFRTSRNQALCKIPVNASFGSYILYNPQVPFPVNINDDFINTFQISLLDENGQPVNNNYSDWSVTLQLDFKIKSNYSLKDDQ